MPSPASTPSPAVASLLDWADELGLGRAGPPESVRERPWSTLVRVPTATEPVWLKAAGAGSRYEATLMAVLRRRTAPHTVLPLAVDERRGFTALPHAGSALRETPLATAQTWERLLAEHAALQRHLEPAAAELLEGGVPDQRPAALAQALDRLLADPPPGLAADRLDRLRACLPAYHRACADLAAYDVPPTLQHDDLHDGNVLVAPDGACRVSDWGDAAVAQPFGVLLVTLRFLADRWGGSAGPGTLRRLRDAYLEPWTDRFARTDLDAAAEIAVRVGRVGRCLSWQRALTGAGDVAEDFASAPAAWLTDLLDSGPEEGVDPPA